MKTTTVLLSLLGMLAGCGNHAYSSPLAASALTMTRATPAPMASQMAPRPAATPVQTPTPARAEMPAETRPAPPQPAAAQSAPPLSPASRTGKQLEIRLYRSFGSEGLIHVRGRVMEPEPAPPANADDSALTNFFRNLDQLSVDEKAGVKVDVTLEGKTVRLVSDAEGMLLTSTELFGRLTPGTHTLSARLVGGQNYWAEEAQSLVMVHPANDSSLGYVSDIDDTIKISEVTNKLSAVRRLLFTNGLTAEAVPGTAALYQVLEAHDGKTDGDFHYLSGSPLNLAGAIYQFLDTQGFPQGSVDLKKWGFKAGDDNPLEQTDYKQTKLRVLLKTFPQRMFICFGDSGEKDPEIYRQISQEFPGRIKAIFINNVTGAKADDARFAGEHLTANAGEAAEILRREGLISAAEVARVRQAL